MKRRDDDADANCVLILPYARACLSQEGAMVFENARSTSLGRLLPRERPTVRSPISPPANLSADRRRPVPLEFDAMRHVDLDAASRPLSQIRTSVRHHLFPRAAFPKSATAPRLRPVRPVRWRAPVS